MLNLFKRLVRHLRGVCLACGAEPIEGCAHCWDCSLQIVGDWDVDKAEALAERYVSLKPIYFEEEEDPPHWAEDAHHNCGDKS